ncbi:MAG: glycosyltransferase [Syntrophales bacterium]|jgi:glycosyltransferase involved in cell wall biosynthesis|nr:glycosyltransferase [Syntrophales bacterium]
MPTVSVIITTYNYGRFIERAIRSVLIQTYQDYEIIVVDDASTDNTEDIVKSIGDDRIRYIRHIINKGGNAARNTGVKLATGDYIAFLDSDDEWLPEKIGMQIRMFLDGAEELGLIYTGMNIIDGASQQQIGQVLPKARGHIFNLLLRGNCITGGGSSSMIKKECFRLVGLFDETLPSGQEWEMILRIAKKYTIEYVNKPLINYFVHGANTDSYPEKIIRGYELILSSHRQDFEEFQVIYAHHYYELGIRCFKNGLMKRGRTHFLAAFRESPRKSYLLKVKSILQLLLSFMGSTAYAHLKKFINP